MNNDPYTILGVSKEASDEEVKAAYSALAKKYHPDRNPGNDAAEQKMKEINAAYDLIKNHKEDIGSSSAFSSGYRSSSYGNSYGGPYGGFGFGGFNFGGAYRQGSYSSAKESSAGMEAAKHYINTGYYREALGALSREANRNARWHYFYALASSGLGNRADALTHAKAAADMEPENSRYANFFSQLRYGGTVYEQNAPPTVTFNPFSIFWIIIIIRFLMSLFFWR